MKSLKQIRTALIEASEDTEAHFVAPTDAQQSVSAVRDEGVLKHMAQNDVEGKRASKADVKAIAKVKNADEHEILSIKKGGVHEALNAEKDPVEKWIADYTKSTDPRFKGMDKSSRIKMALSDFGAAQKAAGKKPVTESHLDGGHEAEEISMTRNELDEIADMADDLFNVLPNFDECPAWVQHKVAGIHSSIHGIYDYYRRKSTERQEAAYACDSGTEPDAIRIAVVSPVNPVPTELPVPPAKM
jgi:hypothetical protein